MAPGDTRPERSRCATAVPREPRRPARNRGINVLRWIVGVFTVKDMRTAREQREANTVQSTKMQLDKVQITNLKPGFQRSHGQSAAAGIERDYLWSRPSCRAMSLRLGASYAIGTGLVPV